MKKMFVVVLVVAMAASTIATAAVTVRNNSEAAREAALTHRLFDHPLTHVVPVKSVKVKVTADQIIRSCCAPPDLLVAGEVVNLNPRPIDYVKLTFNFADKSGKVVYTETIYNSKAVSMGEDAEVARILKEKPHFDPLAPGAVDHFSYDIPLPLLPRYTNVKLVPTVVAQ